MYKCRECGKVYEIKPEYCDCGNDEFIIENAETKINVAEKEVIKPLIDDNTKLWLRQNMPSLVIFFVCIIIAIAISFIHDNSTIQENKNIPQKTETTNKKVNWALFEDKEEIKPKTEVKEVQKTIAEQPKNIFQNKPITQQKPITKKEVQKKATEKNNQTSTKQAKLQAEAKAKAEAKARAEAIAQAKAQAEAKRKAEQAKQEAQKKAEVLRKQKELSTYKQSVAKIFYYKTDFSNVIGQGSCVVTFKIDGNGNLVNKSFSQQSSNTTLNDTVYYAVKNVTRVQTPPSSYKGETLKLKVGFNNGNYAVTVE